jgi:outer membrane receptor protein involved in Fe transport
MVSVRTIIRTTLAIFAMMTLGVSVSAPIGAQVIGATLSGTVTDASGAIVPRAQISIKNMRTGVDTSVTSNSDGFYTVPNVLPGTYEMTASAPGFATMMQSGVTLDVGGQQVLNFQLRLGQITQKLEVTSVAPTVQLSSSAVSGLVDSNTIVELPLNGRDWTQLALLEPGVDRVQTQVQTGGTTSRGKRGNGVQLTISGTRSQLNNYRLDGVSLMDYINGSPGSALGIALGVDAVAEFSVVTANSSAEYGRTAGGVVNATTRSGTNQIHGTAYWFLRDEDFDARNFFDSTLPPFHRNQFGASVGGPIRKDKTFFFFDYEGIREVLGATSVDNVPSQDARAGNLCSIPTGVTPNCTPTKVTVSPLVAPYLPFWPLPNSGILGNGDTGLFKTSNTSTSSENFETVRIDHKFSEKDSIFGTWFYDIASITIPEALDNVLVGNGTHRQMIAVEETHVFSSSLVNSLRGGFSRVTAIVDLNVKAVNPLVLDTSLGTFPGLPAPVILVAGLTDFSGGGVGAFTGDNFAWNSFQAYDDAFLTKGVHSIKFGFAFERTQTNMLSVSDPTGRFKFGSLADFLTNAAPVSFQGEVPGTITSRGARQSIFGGYLQDDWRARRNLTLNLGLRYEPTTVPTDVHNQLVSLPTFTSPPPGHLGSPYFNNPTLRNFEPRVGFAWDPFQNGKTAIRGAFGIFDVLPLNYGFLFTELQSAPFAEVISLANLDPGVFPSSPKLTANISPTSLRTSSIQHNPPRNYVMIWNLSVQHQLSPSTTVTVAYVGNHGVHMENVYDDVNMVIPTATPQGFLWPSPVGSGTILNPSVGDIRGILWNGSSLYDALEVGVSKRMSHGFQVGGSYTWGKNLDSGSTVGLGNFYTNSISSPLWFCTRCSKGPSDFNIAQNLVVNYIWDVPTPKDWGDFASHVLGGWELGGIFTAQSGVPFTPLIAGDPLGQRSTDTYAYPDRLKGPGCRSAVNPGNPSNYVKLNCFALPMASGSLDCSAFGAPSAPIAGTCANLIGNAGRNSVVGPGLVDYDFSVFKNNKIKRISENFNAQLRVEVFNILNRANFGTPAKHSTFFNSSGQPIGGAGAVNNTSTPAREIQFGVKLIW